MLALVIALKNEAISAGLFRIGANLGSWATLGVFLVLLTLIPLAIRALMFWFEHQADDYACARVGVEDMVETLSWLNRWMFGAKGSLWVNDRISRLCRLHELKDFELNFDDYRKGRK